MITKNAELGLHPKLNTSRMLLLPFFYYPEASTAVNLRNFNHVCNTPSPALIINVYRFHPLPLFLPPPPV